MSFYIQDDYVYISTNHFTTFIVAKTEEEQRITDAVVTLAASIKVAHTKRYITLRLMLHVDCMALKDFAASRKKVGEHRTSSLSH